MSGNRRPLLASSCDSLQDAQTHRRSIIRDINKKLPLVQNANLGEYRIRELNDEINKLMNQKHYWEIRIRELGGKVDFGRSHFDVEGKELSGAPGYRYYGAAKDLPGIRELFAEEEEIYRKRTLKKYSQTRSIEVTMNFNLISFFFFSFPLRSRKDLFKFVTPDYYGFRDDDDGILAQKEAEREV